MEDTKDNLSKRTVAPNWTPDEVAVLRDEVTENVKILEDKLGGQVTKIKKDGLWREISNKVSGCGIYVRSPKACKKKWQNDKRKACEKVRDFSKNMRQTGMISLYILSV